jgi:hypothetical protein
MVLAGLCVLKNEGDIVESFVRHNLNYVDSLFLILQPSDDGTDEILKSLVDEGLPLELTYNFDEGFPQGEILTAKARSVLGAGDVDAVIVLDADEFIKSPGPGILRKALASVPQGMCACWTWQSYVPTATGGDHLRPVQEWITHRLHQEHAPVYKVILNETFLDENLVLEMGSHRIRSLNQSSEMENIALVKGSFLAHFPIRTPSQLQRKIANGNRALDIMKSEDPYTCYHWRVIRDIMAKGEVNLELLQLLAADYQFHGHIARGGKMPPLVSDPLTVNYSLRYSHLYRDPSLKGAEIEQ